MFWIGFFVAFLFLNQIKLTALKTKLWLPKPYLSGDKWLCAI